MDTVNLIESIKTIINCLGQPQLVNIFIHSFYLVLFVTLASCSWLLSRLNFDQKSEMRLEDKGVVCRVFFCHL